MYSVIYIIDITDPEDLEIIKVYRENIRNAEAIELTDDLAIVVDEEGLKVFDISDLFQLKYLGVCEAVNRTNMLSVYNNYAFVAYNERVLIIALDNPENPTVITEWEYNGKIRDIWATQDYIYIAAEYDGLIALDITEPAEPFIAGYYDTPGSTRCVYPHGQYILVSDGTNFGIYENSLTHTPDSGRLLIPGDFVLYPAYPNPFNSTTAISYSLPYPSHVSLQVYNTLGQQIITLFEGYKQLGVYATTITVTDDLPSGMYFVRLETSVNVKTQKIMLIR